MAEGKDFFAPSETIEQIATRARSQDPLTRWAAIVELGEIGDERAGLAIRRALSDLDDQVYEAACSAARKLDARIRARVGIALVKVPGGPPRVEIRNPSTSNVSSAGRRLARHPADRVRPRKGRPLRQIPVQEVRNTLRLLIDHDPNLKKEQARAMTLLMYIYRLRETEQQVFRELLDNEWASLLEMFDA
jgi:hypothetical protein